jgi:hypothetical protein
MQAMNRETLEEVFVDQSTGGFVGPGPGFAATIRNGGRIRCVVPPGCWGPMITPDFRGDREVTRPLAVEGTRVCDALAITIESLHALSLATSSGTMITNNAAFGDNLFVDKKCPGCGTLWPAGRVEGSGENCIRCASRGAVIHTFGFEEG